MLKREIEEEVGLHIKNIDYITSMVYIREDKIPTIIVSLCAEQENESEAIKLCSALTDYAWVDLEEAKNYELIEGIYEELEMLNKKLKNEEVREWKKI